MHRGVSFLLIEVFKGIMFNLRPKPNLTSVIKNNVETLLMYFFFIGICTFPKVKNVRTFDTSDSSTWVLLLDYIYPKMLDQNLCSLSFKYTFSLYRCVLFLACALPNDYVRQL